MPQQAHADPLLSFELIPAMSAVQRLLSVAVGDQMHAARQEAAIRPGDRCCSEWLDYEVLRP